MTTYYSNNNLFAYTVTSNSSYTLDSTDYSVIADVFNRWDTLISGSRLGENYQIAITMTIDQLGSGILGGTSVILVYNIGGSQTFGNIFPATASITLNDSYVISMKSDVRDTGKTEYYYVLLHEVGHVLGIGTFWGLSGAPIVSYQEDGLTKYYYTGQHAVREYKRHLSPIANDIVGIPVEDNGLAGTINVHPEEGNEGHVSKDKRYINGVFHPGLDTELMTGWMEGTPQSTPLSRITLGFLEDIGFNVNYNLADYYRPMTNWLDLSNNANCFKSIYEQGFVDLSGGSIQTRNDDQKLIIAGDSSLNNAYLGDYRNITTIVDGPLATVNITGTVANMISQHTANQTLDYKDFLAISGDGKTYVIWHYTGTDRLYVHKDLGDGNGYTKIVDDFSLPSDTAAQVKLNYDGTKMLLTIRDDLQSYGGYNDGGLAIVLEYDPTKTTTSNSYLYSPGNLPASYGPVGWKVMGNHITGPNDGHLSSVYDNEHVSLSDDGLTFAFGVFASVENAYVYTWNGSAWGLKGSIISEPSGVSNSDFGKYLSMSGDGNSIIVGGPYKKHWVFKWSGTTWEQQGGYINIEGGGEQYGQAINTDGTVIAVGDQNQAGRIKIFDRNPSETNANHAGWTQRGNTITGASSAEIGARICITKDGNMVATPTYNNNTQANIYKYNSSNNTWENLPYDTNMFNGLIKHVALSKFGTHIALIDGYNNKVQVHEIEGENVYEQVSAIVQLGHMSVGCNTTTATVNNYRLDISGTMDICGNLFLNGDISMSNDYSKGTITETITANSNVLTGYISNTPPSWTELTETSTNNTSTWSRKLINMYDEGDDVHYHYMRYRQDNINTSTGQPFQSSGYINRELYTLNKITNAITYNTYTFFNWYGYKPVMGYGKLGYVTAKNTTSYYVSSGFGINHTYNNNDAWSSGRCGMCPHENVQSGDAFSFIAGYAANNLLAHYFPSNATTSNNKRFTITGYSNNIYNNISKDHVLTMTDTTNYFIYVLDLKIANAGTYAFNSTANWTRTLNFSGLTHKTNIKYVFSADSGNIICAISSSTTASSVFYKWDSNNNVYIPHSQVYGYYWLYTPHGNSGAPRLIVENDNEWTMISNSYYTGNGDRLYTTILWKMLNNTWQAFPSTIPYTTANESQRTFSHPDQYSLGIHSHSYYKNNNTYTFFTNAYESYNLQSMETNFNINAITLSPNYQEMSTTTTTTTPVKNTLFIGNDCSVNGIISAGSISTDNVNVSFPTDTNINKNALLINNNNIDSSIINDITNTVDTEIQSIVGTRTNEFLGNQIAINKTGDVLVLGKMTNGGEYFSIYELNSGVWSRVYDEQTRGIAVSINDTGDIVLKGDDSGYKVYKKTSGTWAQSAALTFTQVFYTSYWYNNPTCTMNGDGSVMAMSNERNSGNGNGYAGMISIYKYDSAANTLTQLGSTIYGSSALGRGPAYDGHNNTYFISSTGNRIVATDNNNIITYEYSKALTETDGVWSTVGNTVGSRKVLAMDSTGTRICYVDNEELKVYDHDGTNWNVVGQPVINESTGDIISVGMSENGNKIITCRSVPYSHNGSDVNKVYIYKSNANNQWDLLNTLQFGLTTRHPEIALSKDGARYAIGESNYDYDKGKISIYEEKLVPTSINKIRNVHSDIDSLGAFSANVDISNNIMVPGNITIIDSSANNYGAYTVYTTKDASTHFSVGKSASNVFNIVNQNNAGVYMVSGNNSLTSTSDIRLKKEIEPLEDATERIMKLNPCTYKWKTQTDEKRHVGFIAQEVEEVFPELVRETTYPDGSTYKGVATEDFMGYLIKVMENQENELNLLKEKMK